jgi:SSS family solute:Na+ symporter
VRLLTVRGAHAATSLALDMGLCLLATIVVTALTKPAPMDVLVKFYSKVRPFGFWGPVRREAVRLGLVPAHDKMPAIDMLNGLVTAVFQFSLALLPFTAFLRQWRAFGMWAAAAAILAVILYFTWYKNLPAKDEV